MGFIKLTGFSFWFSLVNPWNTFRCCLGKSSVGFVLELGSERNMGIYYLAYFCFLPTYPFAIRMGGKKISLCRIIWFLYCLDLLSWSKPFRKRSSFLWLVKLMILTRPRPAPRGASQVARGPSMTMTKGWTLGSSMTTIKGPSLRSRQRVRVACCPGSYRLPRGQSAAEGPAPSGVPSPATGRGMKGSCVLAGRRRGPHIASYGGSLTAGMRLLSIFAAEQL